MGITVDEALDRLHGSSRADAARWGMSDEVPNMLRDIIKSRLTELAAENALLRESNSMLSGEAWTSMTPADPSPALSREGRGE